MKDNNQIQFKANNQLLFTVKENELDLNKMTVKYSGREEYNFQSSITDVTFTSLLPLKTIDLFKDNKKIQEIKIIKAIPTINFACHHCQQDKQEQPLSVFINGLGIDPHQLVRICADCSDKVDIINRVKYQF